MDMIIPDEVRRSPRLLAAVDHAGKLLEALAPASGRSVRAEWGVFHDNDGRAGLDVSIADADGTAIVRLPPERLSDDSDLKWRLNRLWGDWLDENIRRRIKRIEVMVKEMDEAELQLTGEGA